jgi:predicted signal transduction protein with EAL and GGDEF domain
VICVLRAIKMMRARRGSPRPTVIERSLRTVVWLACTLGVAISVWSLLLFGYGDAYARSQNTFLPESPSLRLSPV